jgi:hypothetical protein
MADAARKLTATPLSVLYVTTLSNFRDTDFLRRAGTQSFPNDPSSDDVGNHALLRVLLSDGFCLRDETGALPAALRALSFNSSNVGAFPVGHLVLAWVFSSVTRSSSVGATLRVEGELQEGILKQPTCTMRDVSRIEHCEERHNALLRELAGDTDLRSTDSPCQPPVSVMVHEENGSKNWSNWISP